MASPSADLATLLARTALGDRAAFERLYRATSGHLLGIALRIVGSTAWAEEVLQDAYVSVWHAAGSYDASLATPMTWLINVVRNKAIDAWRSGRALRNATVELDDEMHAQQADARDSEPQQLIERSLESLSIASCMASLAPMQRQALALAYYRGMVHSEIAAVLGAPLGTAKAWVRRGLDKLRECLLAAGIEGC
jgi:RNA polymerase sigma-70 factor (ECF subfamily)